MTLDFIPKAGFTDLPRGVRAHREYRIYNHEKQAWLNYREFTYTTSIGVAYICLGPEGKLRAGMEAAIKLFQDDRSPAFYVPNSYGVCNSLKNFEDLQASAPLSLVSARSGAYTERSVGKILDTFTGHGAIQPSRLHRLMADRPALTFPYQPFSMKSYRRIKPACVPPEIKMKYVTPFGTEQNELLLAGKIVNLWSDEFYARVRKEVDYTLWITEGEKKAMCLSMLPLLLGTPMDVVGIPGVWMWGKKQPDGAWKLAPELSAYTFAKDGRRRLVGVVFDKDSWRNPKVTDALLKLCECLRGAGAMVFVAIIPPGKDQKGVDDFFGKCCVTDTGFNFEPLVNMLGEALYMDRNYGVNYPAPDVSCRMKTLADKAEAFEAVREIYADRRFSTLEQEAVDEIVREIGSFTDPDSSELNGGHYLSRFRASSEDAQTSQWIDWMSKNPFQFQLDLLLDRYIPGVFRGRHQERPSTFNKMAETVLFRWAPFAGD
jgi:hypothetical protein